MANVLCIRFKGFDPERFLNWLYPWVALVLHAAGGDRLHSVGPFGADAGDGAVPRLPLAAAGLPRVLQLPERACWLSVTLGVTKVLHEFGHGLTCKHFGGECHEMGVMILVLTPCLYCNVSDSWLLPNKWHRAAIGAGGMYVELVLASIATWIWWYTRAGPA